MGDNSQKDDARKAILGKVFAKVPPAGTAIESRYLGMHA